MPRSGHAIPRGARVLLFCEDEIFDITQNHKRYQYGDLVLKDLRKFDDCEPYGLSEEAHVKLLHREIQKLVATASHDGPVLFSSDGHLKDVRVEDFQDVRNVLDQVFCNLAIVQHDVEQIAVEKPWTGSFAQALEGFITTRRLLVSRYNIEEDFIEGSQPTLLEPAERNKALYHAIVDYLLGAVARLWVRSAAGKYWDNHMFAVLAAWAVKLKVIAVDPTNAAETSLANGVDIVDQVGSGGGAKQPLRFRVRIGQGRNAHMNEYATLNGHDDIPASYYREKVGLRRILESLVQGAIRAMLDQRFRPSSPIESFETCGLIYRTGLEDVTTAIHHDRYGDIHCSCDPRHISFIYGAMLLFMQNLDAIRDRADGKSHTPSNSDVATERQDVGATLTWKWQDTPAPSELREGSLHLTHIDDIFTIAVGQCLSTVYTAVRIDNAISFMLSGAREEHPVLQFELAPRSFQAMLHLRTEEFLRRQRSLANARNRDPDVRTLATIPVRHNIRPGTNFESHMQATASHVAHEQTVFDDYRKHKQTMEEWVIDEDSVTVNCRAYVVSVVATAALFICGAMAIPFCVNDRIRGVDPFQITSFAWILVAFAVVLAKSRFVSEWSWHDFLRGQIICSSIRDLQDVSGIDPQIILMFLLYRGRDTILKTKGPYNGMFLSNTEERGQGQFAIDVPTRLSTMYASGFIVLKMLNEDGEHLVVVDARKGASESSARNECSDEKLCHLRLDQDMAKLDDLHSDYGSAKPSKTEPVLQLRMEKFWMKKIVGFYIRDVKFGYAWSVMMGVCLRRDIRTQLS